MEYPCFSCHGLGGSYATDESNRPELDVCYHCQGTGKVSEEQAEADRDLDTLMQIAAKMTELEEKLEIFDCEDWAFKAAESQITLREYRNQRFWNNVGKLKSQFEGLPFLTLMALKELLVSPLNNPIQPERPAIPEEPIPDVPF